MELSIRCKLISNTFYNRGLKLAAERDLSGAFSCLSRALVFNSRNIDARNLLGLVLYETGELGEALAQWVISTNILPERNIAYGYIEDVRSDPEELRLQTESIIQFNQALKMARSGSRDLAIIRLNKITELCPRYLKAQLLLGILHMADGEYRKAMKPLHEVVSIDHGNEDAHRYILEAREHLSQGKHRREEEEPELRISENAEIIRSAMTDNDTVIMPTYREHSWLNTLLQIAAGLIIGAAAVFFLYMPARFSRMTEGYSAQISELYEKLNDENREIDDLNDQIILLREQVDRYAADADSLDAQFAEKLSQYQRLLGILEKIEAEEYIAAAKLYDGIDASLITDVPDGTSVSSKKIYEQISEMMHEDIYARLNAQGDVWYSQDNYSKSLDYYEASMLARKDNPIALYKQGLAYVKLGDRQKANGFFTEVITNYPDSTAAPLAKAERGY